MTVCYRHFLALTPTNWQTRLGIKSVHALVIDLHAFLPQFQVNHAGTVAPVVLRQGDDFFLERGITVWLSLVAEGTRAHARHPQRAAFTQPLAHQVAHQLPP